MSFYFWLGRDANAYEGRLEMQRALLAPYVNAMPPLCDGDFTDEETVEDDGFITVHFSGPIRPIQN